MQKQPKRIKSLGRTLQDTKGPETRISLIPTSGCPGQKFHTRYFSLLFEMGAGWDTPRFESGMSWDLGVHMGLWENLV